jgi:hypothetical protein
MDLFQGGTDQADGHINGIMFSSMLQVLMVYEGLSLAHHEKWLKAPLPRADGRIHQGIIQKNASKRSAL